MNEDPVLDVADRYELTLERALHRSFKRAQDAANVAQFQRALEQRDFAGAMTALHLEVLEDELYGESR